MKNLTATGKITRKIIFLSGIGGMLEFYDFTIFALLSMVLAENFFPSNNHLISLMASFATYAVGYLVRPIGGFVFGHFGDRFGRKNTFMVSILLMAISTLLMGFLPTYAQAGVIAPILLILLRLLQGFSLGGEIPGATTYVSEIQPKARGRNCGIIFCFILSGLTLGCVINFLLGAFLSHSALAIFGWRIAFFIGGLLGFVGYVLRKSLVETPMFTKLEMTPRFPLLTMLRNNWLNMICGILFISLLAGTINVLFLFLPAYLKNWMHYNTKDLILVMSAGMFVCSLIVVACGKLADVMSKPVLMLISIILTFILVPPILSCYVHHVNIWIPMMLTCILLGIQTGIAPVMLTELFKTNVRYSGIACSYNIAFATFGGLGPLIAINLIRVTHDVTAQGYYLIGIAVLCLVAQLVLLFKNKLGDKGQTLNHDF